MKVLISVDAEGLTGLTVGKQTLPNYDDYKLAKSAMTDFCNSAAEGAFKGGASEVTIVDSHDGNRNIWAKDLSKGIKLISGWPKELSMVEGVKDSDQLFFLGYHSMAGTRNGVLNHTYSASVVHRLKYNGEEIGEIGINACVAGLYGKPISLVAGDRAAINEAEKLLPNAELVVLKEGLSRYAAKNESYSDSIERLSKASTKAIQNNGDIYRIEGKIELSLEFQNTGMADNCMLLPGTARKDGYTITMEASDAVDAYRKFRLLVSLGSYEQYGY